MLLTPAPMPSLLLLKLIVAMVLLLLDVAVGSGPAKGPWSTNSSGSLTAHGCCHSPAPPKFNFDFLFPFFGNRATATMTLPFPPNCLTGSVSLLLEATNSKAVPSTSSSTCPPSKNTRALPRTPCTLFPPHRNNALLSTSLRPLPPRWLLPPSSPPHAATGFLPSEIPSLKWSICVALPWPNCVTFQVPHTHQDYQTFVAHQESIWLPVVLTLTSLNPDSIKVVSTCLVHSDPLSSGWSSIPCRCHFGDYLHCYPKCNSNRRHETGFAPPTLSPC